jgi:hypothetical protein
MAGFNISGFRSNGPVEGGARPSLFSVNLTFPSIGEIPSAAESKVPFMARSASLPQSLINKVPLAYFGRKINVAGDRDFTDWQITVYNDEDFYIRDAFEAWHNSINTIISNRLDPRVANIIPQLGNSYKTMGTVTQFSKTGPGDIDGEGSIKTYEFDGMFPTQVDAIRLDWEDGNRIEVFDVTFALDWWIPLRRANDVPIFAVELNPS